MDPAFRSAVAWLFEPPDHGEGVFRTIWWWELRRGPFNLLVGSAGLLSLLAFFAIDALPSVAEDTKFMVGPDFLICGTVANLAYTSSWVVELLGVNLLRLDQARIRRDLIIAGATVSLLAVLAPTGMNFAAWLSRLLRL